MLGCNFLINSFCNVTSYIIHNYMSHKNFTLELTWITDAALTSYVNKVNLNMENNKTNEVY